jgi:hypothetical protein
MEARVVRSVTVEETPHGNVVRWDFGSTGGTEIVKGHQGSVNLRDRTRRFVSDKVADWYPVDRAAPARRKR